MKCKTCKGKMIRTIINTNYAAHDKLYRVANVPAWVCNKCNGIMIDEIVLANIKRYSKLVKGDGIDYQKHKDDDDAAAAAAGGIIM